MEQPIKGIALWEGRLAWKEVIKSSRKQNGILTTGRDAENLTTSSAREAWSDEKFCTSHGPC